MAKGRKKTSKIQTPNAPSETPAPAPKSAARPSALLDTRVVYCGDNLEQLAKLPDACVDLIYIDPPFNSNRNYEVFWGETKEKRSFEDRHASTQAYIDYMRPRCVQLARVLKKTGSFYYHCDWHASHYVKVMLDQIFGENNFVNEVVWKRQTSHNDSKQGSKHYGRLHDTIFLYAFGDDYTWNQQYVPLDSSYIESHYSQMDERGRRFQWGDLRAPGGAAPSKGNPHYSVLGVEGYWRYSEEKMKQLIAEGISEQRELLCGVISNEVIHSFHSYCEWTKLEFSNQPLALRDFVVKVTCPELQRIAGWVKICNHNRFVEAMGLTRLSISGSTLHVYSQMCSGLAEPDRGPVSQQVALEIEKVLEA